MIERGKFRSLTLINWNGFFARTFDLDQLVTTLSGGNGAGKSTTMAAFITALIPDLTLLHFRNTTEAGATSGSRDRGLHGKLRPGVCYAVLDVVNSRKERSLVGVRLQQIAGRDKKVDIKPFSIHQLAEDLQPTDILTEILNSRKAKVLPLNEVKERFDENTQVSFRQYSSVTEYHSMMFEQGIVPRRLRNQGDRSKFYRLIEASLYGGISSAITRSLRDYLLPENGGVRKAFQDMEGALRENRLTLEAIRVTQSDRDLFKHLITESTNYVSADYMRHTNDRRIHLDGALQLRNELYNSREQLVAEQYRQVAISRELSEGSASEVEIEAEYQAANDHLSLVQTAVRQQEKIERYHSELEELTYRLEQQTEVVAEAEEIHANHQVEVEAAELEVDELKSQLADFQQALDVQQTRAIQYQQALQTLEKARQLCQLSELTSDNAAQWLEQFQHREQEATHQVLNLEQRLSVTKAAHSQFAEALELVQQISGPVQRAEAWQVARQLIQDANHQRHYAKQLPGLKLRQNELQQSLHEQQEARRLLAEFNKLHGRETDPHLLETLLEKLQAQITQLTESVDNAQEQRLLHRQALEQIREKITVLTNRAPHWLAAQEILNQLSEQTGQSLTDSQQVTEHMQYLLERERETTVARDDIATKKTRVEQQIEQLSQPGGADDYRLNQLAERLGGVLLSEIYDDVSLDDAPYFSALYGPSRHAIVVPELARIQELLTDLEDCPDDLYLIEGDPQSFDDSVFSVEELERAVVVKVADRQWRYSRFPKVPLFGRAARENRLEKLRDERERLTAEYASLSFDVQKTQRLHQAFSRFIGSHLGIAFEADPEQQIRQLTTRRNDIERAISTHEAETIQQRQQYQQAKDAVALLYRLVPRTNLLLDDSLSERYEEIKIRLEEAQEASRFLQQYETRISKLETVVSFLQSDPEQNEQLQQQHQQLQAKQRQYRQQTFALTEVVQRRAHFTYQDAAGMLGGDSDLSQKLRKQLEQAGHVRRDRRERLRTYQTQLTQATQLMATLKSSYDVKCDMLNELQQEIKVIGVEADANAEQQARIRRDTLSQQLSKNRLLRNQLEKQLTFCEAEIDMLQKKLRKLERDYIQSRQQVVRAKSSWCIVMRLVKENCLERRLHRRELAYQGADELRSMSDKALGALRLAVADNEHLRDVLRVSEDPKYPQRKIHFFIAVYQHLRERIRQDIIRTDDPVEAIEQMEIELNRLTEELTSREQTLAISSRSAANIIRKTIQREQTRIRQLNQGLQAVSFGQVNSVRLNVNIRESHALLLDTLAQEHEQHQDLFNSQRLTFSEAMARLYQRLNPHIDMGSRTPQVIGEELLDYRNYLEMEVEVNRGSDGWLRAESGALSTGEAIGTGMSILVMVVQSWEEESRRLRGKDISPCRLLFLDEAARLDARSIATLFELCDRLGMQLVIAAPENISPEKGTTYKLVRKVLNNTEHVHVVGLRGFAAEPSKQQAPNN